MPKSTNKTKRNQGKVDLTIDSLIENFSTISIKFEFRISFCKNSTQKTKLKQNQTLFDSIYANLTSFFTKKSILITFKTAFFSVL